MNAIGKHIIYTENLINATSVKVGKSQEYVYGKGEYRGTCFR